MRDGSGGDDWPPSADVTRLRQRADWLKTVRRFFAAREVIEVETPLLSQAGVTDVHVESLRERDTGRWLQTSPEYAMKRLLAAGLGDCYQITRAFRAGEQGRWHNPEFTLLEWYRLGFDADRLIDEVAALVGEFLGTTEVVRERYADAFIEAGLPDPLVAGEGELLRAAAAHPEAAPPPPGLGRSGLLDWLFSQIVVPALPARCFVTHYPADQAVLARLDRHDPRVAARFELFCDGVELANGFHELTDAGELRCRFESDQSVRRRTGQRVPDIDERLLAAMTAGLPDCAGVALGLDRLFALAAGDDSLAGVMAFPWDRA
ncbi:EF-P lysine aminoacylase EpmA [Spiribacter onubensis]|uniref:EF-P lysine aminoacylase EpmA n=1 Tax=Spiribacter onubensis TaxID=3122420 RepID=A0ABV3S957_9GAMM